MALASEVHQLLLIARTALDPIPPVFLSLDDGTWHRFAALVVRHGLGPLAYRALSRSGGVPPPVLAALRANAHAVALHNRLLTAVLVRLLGRLDAAGVPAFPFKGPALAVQAYGDVALRPFTDLDIFVRREDVPRARAVLLQCDWTQPQGFAALTPAELAAYVDTGYHLSFGGPANSALELHWAFAASHFTCRLDTAGIWDRLAPVALAGTTVRTPAPMDLLPFLCLHGAKHCWERLEWLCSIAALIRRSPDLDWDQILRQARDRGTERMILAGLKLAHDLLGSELPSGALRRVAGLPHGLTARVMGWLFAPGRSPSILERHRFFLSLQERWRDRAVYVWYHVRHANRPGADDLPRQAVSVSGLAFRLMRLSKKYILAPWLGQQRVA